MIIASPFYTFLSIFLLCLQTNKTHENIQKTKRFF